MHETLIRAPEVGGTLKLCEAEKIKKAGREARVALASQPAFFGARVGCLPKCYFLGSGYVVQAIPHIDAEIAEKGRFSMGTVYYVTSLAVP